MDAGDYLIRVGDSSRNTAVAAKLRLRSKVVTEKLSTQFDDQTRRQRTHRQPEQLLQLPGRGQAGPQRPGSCRLPPSRIPHHQQRLAIAQSVPVDASSGYYPLDGPCCRRPPPTPPERQLGRHRCGLPGQDRGDRRRRSHRPPAPPCSTSPRATVSMRSSSPGSALTNSRTSSEGASPGTDITPGVAGTTTAALPEPRHPGMPRSSTAPLGFASTRSSHPERR